MLGHWSVRRRRRAGNGGGGATIPLKPLQARRAQNIRSGRRYCGQIIGAVTKDAARVQVLFRSGIAPVELVPIQAGDRFPVNFFVGFYRQQTRTRTWSGS